MEFLLAVILPIAILAGSLVAIRVVRNKQRNRELESLAPTADEEVRIPSRAGTDGASVKHDAEQVEEERTPPPPI